MKKILFAITAAMVLISSCGKNTDAEKEPLVDGKIGPPHFECRFYGVDAYKRELKIQQYGSPGRVYWFFEPAGDYDFYQAHRLTGDWVGEKEVELADRLVKRGYDGCYEVEEHITRPIMYAGVSGDIVIVSDQEVAGRKAGENLSDLFFIRSLGRLTYPDMEIIQDERQPENWAPERFPVLANEYFSIGCIPFALDNAIVLESDLIEEIPSLHIEIPVTGLTSTGEEKTVVFAGDYIAE